MARTSNLAVLVARGGDAEIVAELVAARRGRAMGQGEAGRIYGFSSPTDAVLAGLDAAGGPAGNCAAGVALGEVEEAGAGLVGRPVEVAGALAGRASDGEVLVVEAVYLAMNRVEVGATPTNLDPGDEVGQRIYRAQGGQTASEEGEALPPAEEPAAPAGGSAVTAVGLLLACAVGFLLAGAFRAGGPSGGTLAARARELSARGQHREAAEAFWKAYSQDPGTAVYEARFRESVLEAAAAREREGRWDAAFHLLHDALERDPFRRDLEDRLVEVGVEYLGALQERGSELAYAREEPLLLSVLPLREQEIRDRLVGIKVRAAMDEWRSAKVYPVKNKIYNERIGPLWEETKDHPELWLANAEVVARDSRIEKVIDALNRVLDLRPAWRTERPEVRAVLLASIRELDSAYERKRYMSSLVDFAAQRVPDLLDPEAPGLLKGDAVGGRTFALRYLDARGRLEPAAAAEAHRRNLLGAQALDDRESPLKDPLLVEAAAAFARKVEGTPRQTVVQGLRAAARAPDATDDFKDAARAALDALGER